MQDYNDEELWWLARAKEHLSIEPPKHIAKALRDAGLIVPTVSGFMPTMVGLTVLKRARIKGRLPRSGSDQTDNDEA
jgi:hypothetical protein